MLKNNPFQKLKSTTASTVALNDELVTYRFLEGQEEQGPLVISPLQPDVMLTAWIDSNRALLQKKTSDLRWNIISWFSDRFGSRF